VRFDSRNAQVYQYIESARVINAASIQGGVPLIFQTLFLPCSDGIYFDVWYIYFYPCLLYGRKMALQFKEFMADGNITGVFYFIFLIL